MIGAIQGTIITILTWTPTCTVAHPLIWAPVWEKKLLSSVLSPVRLSLLKSPPISWILSTSISLLLSLSNSPVPLPAWTRLYLVDTSLLPSSLSSSLPLPMCASVVQSVYIHWPCPHYRHNTAAAGCLCHRRHCRFLTCSHSHTLNEVRWRKREG